METKNLRGLDAAALEKELRELQRAHFSLRMQKATQQLQNPTQIRKARRDIARVRTIMAQKANAK